MQQHEPDLAVFPLSIDGVVATLTVDLAWREKAPDARCTTWFAIIVPVDGCRPDGMPTAETVEMMAPLEESLIKLLGDASGALHVGSMWLSSSRHWFLYVPDAAKTEALVRQAFAGAEIDASFISESDPEWLQYREGLYPDAETLRFAGDLRVCSELEAAGDVLTTPRLIEHIAHFPDSDAAARFVRWCGENDFSVEPREGTADETAGFDVCFSHFGPAEFEAVNTRTSLASAGVASCGGEYDGWGSSVMRG